MAPTSGQTDLARLGEEIRALHDDLRALRGEVALLKRYVEQSAALYEQERGLIWQQLSRRGSPPTPNGSTHPALVKGLVLYGLTPATIGFGAAIVGLLLWRPDLLAAALGLAQVANTLQ